MKQLIRKILKEYSQEEIDRILDKINAKGIDSLTSLEKKILSNVDGEATEEENDLDGVFKELSNVFKNIKLEKLTYDSTDELVIKIKDKINTIYENFIDNIEYPMFDDELELSDEDNITQQYEFFGSIIEEYFEEIRSHLNNLNDRQMGGIQKYLNKIYNKLWDYLNR